MFYSDEKGKYKTKLKQRGRKWIDQKQGKSGGEDEMRREKMQVYTFEGFVKREGAQSRNKKVKKISGRRAAGNTVCRKSPPAGIKLNPSFPAACTSEMTPLTQGGATFPWAPTKTTVSMGARETVVFVGEEEQRRERPFVLARMGVIRSL